MKFYFEERLPINMDGGICCGCKDGYAHGCGYLVHCNCGCRDTWDVHICLGIDEHYILEIVPEDVGMECFCGPEKVPSKLHGCMNYHYHKKRFYYNFWHLIDFLNPEVDWRGTVNDRDSEKR